MRESVIYRDTIYRTLFGSRAYGTHRPDSDWDEKGVCVLRDPRYYFGFHTFNQKDGEWEDGADRVIFDVRKFVNLALECNPSIIEVLYVDESDILQMDELGKMLRDSRDLFLTRRATRTFIGYAVSQLNRAQGHYRWIQDPPTQPEEADYRHTHILGVTQDGPWEREFDNHVVKVYPAIPRRERPGRGDTVKIEHFAKGDYKKANKKYRNFLDWRKKRNPARAELEERYGYDCKHAYHLIRLLRMGKEILTDGKVIVKRPDAADLLEIRNGKYTYDELLEYADQLKSEVQAAEENSPLPPEPDVKAAEKLLIELVRARLEL